MALSSAEAAARKVAQTLSITAAAVALNSYAADGTPSSVAATGSAANNTVELVRDANGRVFGIRGNAGAVLSRTELLGAAAVFKFLFEGAGAAGTKVGTA